MSPGGDRPNRGGLSGGDAGTSYFVLGGLLACSRWPGNTACDDAGLRGGPRMGPEGAAETRSLALRRMICARSPMLGRRGLDWQWVVGMRARTARLVSPAAALVLGGVALVLMIADVPLADLAHQSLNASSGSLPVW